MCDGHHSLSTIINKLAEKLSVPLDELSDYVCTLLDRLETAKAIRVDNEVKPEVMEAEEIPNLGDLSIGITSQCNLTCKHCYIGKKHQ